MPVELEERLERMADALPQPREAARERARSAALGALQASDRRRGRRLRFALAAGAISAAAAVVLILVAPWQSSPLATERALAALGDQPVIHAIVEDTASPQTIVDVATGKTHPERNRTEYWYDGGRDSLRMRLSVAGRLLAEMVQTPEGTFTDRGLLRGPARAPQLPPALAGFATRYREALESGQAKVVGDDTVDSRGAILLRIALPPGPGGEERSVDVAVDADTYRPLRFRYSPTPRGSIAPWWRVVEIEAIPRDPRDFAPPPKQTEPQRAGQTGNDDRTLTPDEAAKALDRPALWAGQAVEGLELTKIGLVRLTTRWTDGTETQGRALELQYGADRRAGRLGEPWLLITEATSAEENFRFDAFGGPPLAEGQLRLKGVGAGYGSEVDMWFGSMQKDGVYISLESPQQELVLAAARSLRPIG
jgi:hypothetical protein